MEIQKGIMDRIKKKKGISIGKNGQEPTDGYMVSIPGHEVKIPIDDACDDDVFAYLADKFDTLERCPNAFFGSWVSDGFVYLDISINIDCLEIAKYIGKEFGQKAIFDVENKCEIFL